MMYAYQEGVCKMYIIQNYGLLWYRVSFTIVYVKRFIIVTFALKYLNP